MKVIDNFLEQNEFLNIKNYLESDTFEWYYNNYVISENIIIASVKELAVHLLITSPLSP